MAFPKRASLRGVWRWERKGQFSVSGVVLEGQEEGCLKGNTGDLTDFLVLF